MLGYTFIFFKYTPKASFHLFGYVSFTLFFYNANKESLWHALPNWRISFVVPFSDVWFIHKFPSFNRSCEYFYGTFKSYVLRQKTNNQKNSSLSCYKNNLVE